MEETAILDPAKQDKTNLQDLPCPHCVPIHTEQESGALGQEGVRYEQHGEGEGGDCEEPPPAEGREDGPRQAGLDYGTQGPKHVDAHQPKPPVIWESNKCGFGLKIGLAYPLTFRTG